MYKLVEITHSKMDEIVESKEIVEVEIPADVAKFQDEIPNVDFSKEQEIAPTSMAFEGNNKWLFINLTDGEINRLFIRFILEIYDNSGKIFYQKLESGNYKATVKWN